MNHLDNGEIAEMLNRAAQVLAMRGENRYRVRAYMRAARSVASCPTDVETLIREGRLQALEGVGAGLAQKIKEIVRTGRLPLLERMGVSVPSLDADRAVLLASAVTLADILVPELKSLPGVKRVAVTGETRRRKETVRMLELVLAVSDPASFRETARSCKGLHHLRLDGNFCLAVHDCGINVTLFSVAEHEFALTLWLTTGTSGHIDRVSEQYKKRTGSDLLCQGKGAVSFASEAEIYRQAGLPFIEPELREDQGEVEAALRGQLPRLVSASDYRGDLHVHTSWSDGAADLEDMVRAASGLGYEYLAVTDHSSSLKVARGLSLERLVAQCSALRALRGRYPCMSIFTGIEVDILDDGSLDAPDEVLAGLDVVIASVHSGFRQDREQMTKRICSAMENPYVQIVAHPTGRLLGRRRPYDVDMDQVIRRAAVTGTILEVNASPDRLDLDARLVRQAKEAGVMVAVNTDAHSQLELANVQLGLSIARRGWLQAGDVANTRSTRELVALLSKKRTKSRCAKRRL